MDVLYFLKDRTRFISKHYEVASSPFRELMRKIEAEEAPFQIFDRSEFENEEPAFLTEWIEAKTSLEVVGLACVSMLSESLKLYFKSWEGEIGIQCEANFKEAFKRGFVQGYKTCFGQRLNVDWSECPSDVALLEQIVLARNASQHPEHISQIGVKHPKKDRQKFATPFFMSDEEKTMMKTWPEIPFWLGPQISVTSETLVKAAEEIEKLADWLEPKLLEFKRHRGKHSSLF